MESHPARGGYWPGMPHLPPQRFADQAGSQEPLEKEPYKGIEWHRLARGKNAHIVFLFSDTGGGHRSAAEAIIEAIDLEYPGQFECKMVDFFKEYSPPPFNLAGPMYPLMSRMEFMWEFTFKVER